VSQRNAERRPATDRQVFIRRTVTSRTPTVHRHAQTGIRRHGDRQRAPESIELSSEDVGVTIEH
jgi:hypothetical protein